MNNWTEVTIWTSTAGIDAVTGMLMDLGIDGFVIEDSQDFEDFLHDTEIYWDYVDEKLSQEKKDAETNVKIYVEDSPAGAEMLAQVNAGLAELRARDTEKAFGRCVTELASIRQEDWENNWKQYFKPFRVGRKPSSSSRLGSSASRKRDAEFWKSTRHPALARVRTTRHSCAFASWSVW